MIYTVTFNPALDYIDRLDSFTAGEINRVKYEQVLGGGKGINVSIVLKNLGHDSTALGFLAGFTGKEIIRQLDGFGCQSDFVELPEGFSRINVKVKAETETEINGQGPRITPEAQAELFAKLDKLQAGDTLVLAGSIPNTLPDDIYQRIMSRLEGRNINIVVDATKQLLLKVLPYKPFLIKPNTHELGEMFGVVLKPKEGTVYESAAPKGTLVNSVGAGDSMVAGFICGYKETGSLEEAFYMGVATGSASAFSENLATRAEADALLKTIH